MACVLSTIVLVATRSVGAWAESGSSPSSSAPSSIESRPEPEFAEIAPLHGVAAPRLQSTIVAQVGGMVVEVLVEEGQRVVANQPLMTIDARVARAQVEVAKAAAARTAEARRAELALERAELQYKWTASAHRAKAGTDAELTAARIEREQASATLEAARQDQQEAARRLELAEAQLSQHQLRAPFAGRVTRIFKPLGANAVAGETEMITVAALDQLEVELYLPVEYYGRLNVSARRTVSAGAPVDARLPARIKSVSPVIDPATRSLRCVLSIDNPQEKLPAGFAVQLVD